MSKILPFNKKQQEDREFALAELKDKDFIAICIDDTDEYKVINTGLSPQDIIYMLHLGTSYITMSEVLVFDDE
jgi:siroheme synthase (precorrin-2 oxidase/ferrochelatase)